MNDPVLMTLVVAAGVTLAWFLIHLIVVGERARWRMMRKIRCWTGHHAAGPVKGEVGGRNVQRCLYCDKIVYQYTVTKDFVRRKI